jgi:hypothetical protein
MKLYEYRNRLRRWLYLQFMESEKAWVEMMPKQALYRLYSPMMVWKFTAALSNNLWKWTGLKKGKH